jgi:hypothetical protein
MGAKKPTGVPKGKLKSFAQVVRAPGWARGWLNEPEPIDPEAQKELQRERETVANLLLDEVEKHSKVQAEKARNPRTRRLDPKDRAAPTTLEVVAEVVGQHDADATPAELLPHLHVAMNDYGLRPIGDKHAKELLSPAIKARKLKIGGKRSPA